MAQETGSTPAAGTSRRTGELELEDGVLVIKRIDALLHVKAPLPPDPPSRRVHGFYADKRPVYRSIHEAIAITSSFEPES